MSEDKKTKTVDKVYDPENISTPLESLFLTGQAGSPRGNTRDCKHDLHDLVKKQK